MHVSDPCIEHIWRRFFKKNTVTEFTRPGVRNCLQCVRRSPIWRGVRYSDFYYVHQWQQSPNKEIIWKPNIDHRAKRTVALYDEMRHHHGPKEPREARSVRNSAHWSGIANCLHSWSFEVICECHWHDLFSYLCGEIVRKWPSLASSLP